MANRKLFKSLFGSKVPPVDAINDAGGRAYAFGPKHALAQFAATGCLNSTYYANATGQLDQVLALCRQVDPEFIAKTAVFMRERSYMKDMPALLLVSLAAKTDAESKALLRDVFPRVVDNGRMLRNFVQILRSGAAGRKSLGTLPRRLVRNFLLDKDPGWLFRQSVGQSPSMGDIVKMVHPKPRTEEQDALFSYFIGKVNGKSEHLPTLVKGYEAWKKGGHSEPPKVPFELLTNQPLSATQWAAIARHGNWHFTRMNLNTFVRHGVFEVAPELVELIAARLRDVDIIKRARVFPYQVMMTSNAVGRDVPREIVDALHDALEASLVNIPAISGRVLVFPDVSGSMNSPVTGFRKGSTTAVKCVAVAGLFSAAVLRRNPDAIVVPVDTKVHTDFRADPRDSVMTNATRLAMFGGGGTALSAALAWANEKKLVADAVIMISDYESWADPHSYGCNRTALMGEWRKLKARCPKAKLVCIDIQPYRTTQAPDLNAEILNIAGFNDSCFSVIDSFLKGDPRAWIDSIEDVTIE